MSRVALVLASLFAAGSLAAQQPKDPPKSEPKGDGKQLAEWAKQLASKDAAVRQKAETALRAATADADALADVLLTTAAGQASLEPLRLLVELGPRAVPTLNAGLWPSDHPHRGLCLMVIARIGNDARGTAPSLIRLLSDPDEEIRRTAAGCLWEVGAYHAIPALVKALDDRSVKVRAIAADSLVRLGADPTPVIPVLAELVKDPNHPEAAGLLGQLGREHEAAIAPLIEALPKATPEMTARIADALARIGPGAKAAIDPLKKKLAEKDDMGIFRGHVALALWFIDRSPDAAKTVRREIEQGRGGRGIIHALWRMDSGPETVATLTKLLDPEQPQPAIVAAEVFGNHVKDAVPLLSKLAASKDAKVRAAAVVALVTLGPQAKDAADALKAAMRDEVPQTAFWATVGTCRLNPTAENVAALAAYLGDPDAGVRNDAAGALGTLGAAAKPAVARLITSLEDAEEAVRHAAAVALWRIDNNPAALPAMTKLLRSTDARVRELAVIDLGAEFGAEAKPAVPELVKRLFDPFASMRSWTGEALGRMGPAAKDAVPALLAVLESDEPGFVHSAACEAVGLIGPADKDAAVAVLKRKLDHPDALTRVHAALALFLVAADKSGEKEAERGLKSGLYQVRITAAEALWRMKQDARVVPLLVRSLEEANIDGGGTHNERYMVARALGRIGPAGKPAVAELRKLLTHPDPMLVATAAAAIKAIELEPPKK